MKELPTIEREPAGGNIKFNWQTMKWEGLTVSQIETWQRLYPDIDVFEEVTKKSIRWLDWKRGTKKPMKKNWRTFITNWLKKEQGKAVGIL